MTLVFDEEARNRLRDVTLQAFSDMGVSEPFALELVALAELHAAKAADYGRPDDPAANLRASARFGVPPWVGSMIRLNDKVERVASFIRNGRLRNEPIEDSLRGIAVDALLAKTLLAQEVEASA